MPGIKRILPCPAKIEIHEYKAPEQPEYRIPPSRSLFLRFQFPPALYAGTTAAPAQHADARGYAIHKDGCAGVSTHSAEVRALASLSCGNEGRRSSTDFSQPYGSTPFSRAVSSRLMMAAARCPACNDPANSHVFRPITTCRIARSHRLLSSGSAPSSTNLLNYEDYH